MNSVNLNKYLLLLYQLVAHVAFLVALFTFSLADWGISFFVYFLTGCLGVSVTFHRYLAHKSWKAPKWWIYVGSLLGTWGLIGSPIAWANNHIAHHRYVDTDKDPHSPVCMPWWKVQWFSMLTSFSSFKFATKNINPFQVFLHKYYFLIHFVIFVSLIAIGGTHLVMLLYLVPAAILWNLASLVNTINHSSFGYRNFDTKDSSVNNFITGYLTWGEGWHNNHHAHPGNYKYGVKPYEYDISSKIIQAIVYVSGTQKFNK